MWGTDRGRCRADTGEEEVGFLEEAAAGPADPEEADSRESRERVLAQAGGGAQAWPFSSPTPNIPASSPPFRVSLHNWAGTQPLERGRSPASCSVPRFAVANACALLGSQRGTFLVLLIFKNNVLT